MPDPPKPLTDADLDVIEHGLVDCEGRGMGYCQHVVEVHQVGRLVAEVRRMRALLRRLQWTRSASVCPMCGVAAGREHAPECDLAADVAAPESARRRGSA